jgi:hypothetical protein
MVYGFDHYAAIWGYDLWFKRYENQKGKLFIATVRNDGETRLYGRSLIPAIDMEDKEGWWRTFTICKKPLQKGNYIVEIVNVRPDKDGYPIFEVEVISPIEEDILQKQPVMGLFLASGCFEEVVGDSIYDWNIDGLKRGLSQYVELPAHCWTNQLAKEAVMILTAGSITVEQIVEWLESPTDEELRDAEIKEEAKVFWDNFVFKDFKPYVENPDAPKWVNEWNKNDSDKAEAYLASIEKMDVSIYPHICAEAQEKLDNKARLSTQAFLDWHQAYRRMVRLGNIEAVTGSYLAQIDAYLAFNAARQAAEKARKAEAKAKKTADKKAKKQAAKQAKQQAMA